jgi:hypothetical protein
MVGEKSFPDQHVGPSWVSVAMECCDGVTETTEEQTSPKVWLRRPSNTFSFLINISIDLIIFSLI